MGRGKDRRNRQHWSASGTAASRATGAPFRRTSPDFYETREACPGRDGSPSPMILFKEDIVQAIRGAQPHSQPFLHLRLSSIFGDEEYRQILRMLPSMEDCVELRHKDAILPDGTSSRRVFPLTDRMLAPLDQDRRQFWSVFADALRHPYVARGFVEKFAKFGCKAPRIRFGPAAVARTRLADVGLVC